MIAVISTKPFSPNRARAALKVASLRAGDSSNSRPNLMMSASSGVWMVSTASKKNAGPASSLILTVRSKENLTSSEVSLLPLLNFSPLRRVHL